MTLIDNYTQHRNTNGELADSSTQILNYRLHQYANWLTKPVTEATPHDIETWVGQPDLAAAYRHTRLSTLTKFYAWLLRHHHIDNNPCDGITVPPIPKRAPRHLPTDSIRRLLRVAANPRDRLIVLLQVQEGLRRAEVAAADVTDYDPDRRVLAVRGKGGRGNITRYVPVSDQTAETIAVYATTGPLVRSHKGQTRLTPPAVSKIVTRLMYRAGIKTGPRDGISAHALRHTAATDVLRGGGNIVQVQAMLGHANLQSTQVYVGAAAEGLADVMGGRDY